MRAPIALFVYNRPDYLSQTISALQKNKEAIESDLFVFCDGARSSASEDEKRRIGEVRSLVRSLSGFKSVTVSESETNKGLANSIVAGVSSVLEKYGTVIVLEDDIVTSPFFLKYMNDGLEHYKNEDAVISIHGYNYPADFASSVPETFFIRGADCWGWATWKRGWELFNPDANALIKQLEGGKLESSFDFNGTAAYMEMLRQTAVRNHSWAVKWYASAFLLNKLTLYPKHSLVVNIGAEGTNSAEGDMHRFGKFFSDKEVTYFELKIEENLAARKSIEHYFSGGKTRTGISGFIRSLWQVLKS